MVNPNIETERGQAHYRNLTNGLNCPHTTPHFKFIRLQSTACEQKRWNSVLLELGAEFYLDLITGKKVVVHDQSEKDRETRACWQGLSWIRYATSVAWRTTEPVEKSRGGVIVTSYWRESYLNLPRPVVNYLKYFRKFDQKTPIQLVSCWGADHGRN